MAKYSSADVAFLLVDGYNLLGVTTDLEEDSEALLEESHGLGEAWQKHAGVGLQKAALSQQGFYDDAADSVNAALSGQQQTSRIVCYGFEGNTIGKRFVGLAGAFGAMYKRVANRGALHKANAQYTVTGQKDQGVILHALSAETGNGNTEGASSQDAGTSSANGGAGYFQLPALTLGTATNLTAKVRHSADDVTYADLVTFAAVIAGPNAQRVSVAGTVNRHLASSWTFGGTPGGGTTATFAVGFARG